MRIDNSVVAKGTRRNEQITINFDDDNGQQ